MPSNAALPKTIRDSLKKIEPSGSADESIARLLLRNARQRLVKYDALQSHFEAKYRVPFAAFKKRLLSRKEHDFALEQDLFDWDMAVTAAKDMKEEIRKLSSLFK
jgi:hypothetical protein